MLSAKLLKHFGDNYHYMIEFIINESFPLRDESRYVNVVASIAHQYSGNPIPQPVCLEFDLYCVNACEHPHIVSADAHKYVVNALVVAQVLGGVWWKYINGFVDTFHIDAGDPRVVVRVI